MLAGSTGWLDTTQSIAASHVFTIGPVVMADLTYFLSCPSPTAFPKKYVYEPFIRRFVPELKVHPQIMGCCNVVDALVACTSDTGRPAVQDMPKQYLLEPWKAPEAVQKKAHCIIGKDYPAPIVEHNAVYKENILRRVCNYSGGLHAWVGSVSGFPLVISLARTVCRIKAAYDADKLSAKRKAPS